MKRIAAAIILFTRIPLWRRVEVPQVCYDSAVAYWPLCGWITSWLTVIVFLGFLFVLHDEVPALVLAVAFKLLLTGGLHEDGMADFFDGFGGGRDKEGILSIMKDSHIGTYGVLALVLYYALLFSMLLAVRPMLAAVTMLAADPLAKCCAAQISNCLPYARPEGAKNKISYRRMSGGQLTWCLAAGLLPLGLLVWLFPTLLAAAAVLPALTAAWLIHYLRRKIGGYTGDCCGAAYMLCELSMIFGICFLSNCFSL